MVQNALFSLPLELLQGILDSIPARNDLLSLALTCSYLRDLIIPAILDYRLLVAAEYHVGLWRHLIDHPYYARNVRQLTLFNRVEAVGRKDLFRRLPSDVSSSGSQDELDIGDALTADEDRGIDDLRAALTCMSDVRALHIRASGRVPERRVKEGKDVLSVACSQLRNLEQIRVSWSRTSYPPDFFDLVYYPICELHPLWQLSNLKSLEFPDLWMSASVWPSFCDMLSRSPELKVLTIPVFLPSALSAASPMPKLPHLRRLSVPASFTNAVIQELLLDFLSDHTNVHELRWSSSLLLPTSESRFPALPSLRTFRDTDTFFIERFLQGRPSASVKLRTLDRIAFYFEPQRLLDALTAVQPDSLTRVCIACLDSRATLLALARMFPALENLTLPTWCAWTKPRLIRRLGRAVWRAMTLHQGISPRHDWRRVAIHDVVPLFPKLRVVRHVDVGDPMINRTRSKDSVKDPPSGTKKTMDALRNRYPRLESVNGWKLR